MNLLLNIFKSNEINLRILKQNRDITGKAIDELVNSELLPGAYEITWDATNYSSGMYFYKTEKRDARRIVLVK
ncbi:MAG: hypothetical protein K1X86_00135 [Ignavibacteria bacterium]|nr:hypothetical protein [Ignavibacteria bacterium]